MGRTETIAYDNEGRINTITDASGRFLHFGYNDTGRLSSLTDPAGGIITYTYDALANLTSVTYPDGTSKTYHYEDSRHPHALTGITDENGDRYATYAYDEQGRANLSEHAGGADRVALTYNPDGTTTVTDPLGMPRTHTFTTLHGVIKSTGQSQPGGSGCGPASSQMAYDVNGNMASRTDFNGNRTCHAHDLSRNLETLRLEGLGSGNCPASLAGHVIPAGSLQRKTHTEWHPDWQLPTRRAEPLKRSTWVYNGQSDPDNANRILTCAPPDALVIDQPIAVLCQKTEQATDDETGQQGFAANPDGQPRIWRYTYDRFGKVLSEDGPRTDIADITTHQYWPSDATCPGATEGTGRDKGCRGQLQSTTNTLNQTTRYDKYNAHGQPESIVSPNGLVTTLSYDPRQRLIRRDVGGEVTEYRYDRAGQLLEIQSPDGSRTRHQYDAAHRLIGIADGVGNRIDYRLDAKGNQLAEETYDPQGQLAQTRQREYDALSRLWLELGARPGDMTEYAYDAQGNLTHTTDALGRITQRHYDPLNRLIRVLQPAGVNQASPLTEYAYNGQDQLTQVTDPRQLVTRYDIDGFGETLEIQSPDTGKTQFSLDAAGNLIRRVDAKGQVTTYTYDALNRISQARYHDGSRHAYSYDQGSNGIGRLTRLDEYSAANVLSLSTVYTYDSHGRLLNETRSDHGQSPIVTTNTAYQYDTAGRLGGITYPSGRQVVYQYDLAGRINRVDTTADAGSMPRPVVRNVTYHPFGGVSGYVQANGVTQTREHDLDGRLASYTLENVRYDIDYDPAGQIVAIQPASGSPNLYSYDAQGRIEAATLPLTQSAGYTYDAVGNRLSRTLNGNTQVNTYAASSNRLTRVAGTPVTFDANGSLISNGATSFHYDSRGRLVQAGATTYRIDAHGRRIRKTGSQADTRYHYDAQHRLIAEHAANGTVLKEYLWLGDLPVAVLAQ